MSTIFFTNGFHCNVIPPLPWFVPADQIDDESILIQVVSGLTPNRRKPSPEEIVPMFIVAYMYPAREHNEFDVI